MTKLERIQKKAEQLYALRQQINEREEKMRAEVEALKTARDALQDELVASLDDIGIKSIKVTSGDSFTLASRKGFRILNETRALAFAKEHNAVKVDSLALAKIIEKEEMKPDWAEAVESKYISVRKAKS